MVTEATEGGVHDRQIILNIFSAIGRCRVVEEKHFDACTALAGSGPAFMCTILEVSISQFINEKNDQLKQFHLVYRQWQTVLFLWVFPEQMQWSWQHKV